MKTIAVLTLITTFYFQPAYSQTSLSETPTAIEASDVSKAIYAYPDFTQAKVVFRNGGQVTEKLNYNLLEEKLQFINGKGDTLSVANNATLKHVLIFGDTIVHDANEGYIKILPSRGALKLGVRESLKLTAKKKKGALGIETNAPGIETLSMNNRQEIRVNLSLATNYLFSKKSSFYIFHREQVFPATEKNILKSFPTAQDSIKGFIKAEKLKLNKFQDLEKLSNHLSRS